MKIVSFGKRSRMKFWSGGTLNQWQTFSGPAIYALTYKEDAQARPKSHTVLYFGETEDLAQPSIHSDLIKWHENYHVNGDLYFFFHPMPGSTQYERAKVKQQLTLEYNPKASD